MLNSQQKKRKLDSYRRGKAREVAERGLLADGSNQHSTSVQLVSAREDHSSAAARGPNTLLHTGGEEREDNDTEKRCRNRKKVGHGVKTEEQNEEKSQTRTSLF